MTEPAPPGPTNTEHLDLATVIEVSQAASGEILLEKLIETVMVGNRMKADTRRLPVHRTANQ